MYLSVHNYLRFFCLCSGCSLDQGVEVALHRAKVWSKYAKDVLSYVEKRTGLEMEYAKNAAKLAQTMRCALKEDVSRPGCQLGA